MRDGSSQAGAGACSRHNSPSHPTQPCRGPQSRAPRALRCMSQPQLMGGGHCGGSEWGGGWAARWRGQAGVCPGQRLWEQGAGVGLEAMRSAWGFVIT